MSTQKSKATDLQRPPFLDPANSQVINKEWLRQKLAEQDAQTGETYVLEHDLTPESLQTRIAEKLRARGIDPDKLRYQQRYDGE